MGSALTAAGDSGPGAVPRAGQTPAAPGSAPRGEREAAGPPWGKTGVEEWVKEPPRVSLLAPLLFYVDHVTSASPRTNFSPSAVC